ncbi:hypothetical protein ACSHWB_18085 [Lentzea sp. HUAS TT2]|uniref:hypothetical protein n=1 Tax=Lentzea sp. HUAS TT2 TaxID=3447454 RepID=UPI003F719A57
MKRHAIALVCAGLLAACSPAPPEPVPSAVPVTMSTPDQIQALDVKVKAALLSSGTYDTPSGFAEDVPQPYEKLAITDGRLSEVCLGARVDVGASVSRRRIWRAPALYLEHQVFGLVGVSGTHVLDVVRAKAHSCRTYVGRINKPIREVVTGVDLAALPDAEDSFAFCQSMPDVIENFWVCEGFVVRGDLVAKVVVGAHTLAPARYRLPDVVEAAEAALVQVR